MVALPARKEALRKRSFLEVSQRAALRAAQKRGAVCSNRRAQAKRMPPMTARSGGISGS